MESISNYVSVNLSLKAKGDMGFPFLDYGFLYGYGLFETILIRDGNPVLFQKHLNRLKRGAIILDIPFPNSDVSMKEAVLALIEKNDYKDGVLNIYLTPGDRPADHIAGDFSDHFLLMLIRPLNQEMLNKHHAIEVRPESFQRTPMNRLKTLSYIKNIMERRLSVGYDDVLLYDNHQHILETTQSNVFFVKGTEIYTPKSPVILPGVTKQFLIASQNAIGYKVIEEKIQFSDLKEFDEIFLTNAIKGVILVDKVMGFDQLVSGEKTGDIKKAYYRELGVLEGVAV